LVLGRRIPVGHHAFAAEFDAEKPVHVEGNRDEDGMDQSPFLDSHRRERPGRQSDAWMVEGGAPNALLRRGFSKDSLPAGTEIVIEGYQAKNGSKKANGRDITFADAESCSSGRQAPGLRARNARNDVPAGDRDRCGRRRRCPFAPASGRRRRRPLRSARRPRTADGRPT